MAGALQPYAELRLKTVQLESTILNCTAKGNI